MTFANTNDALDVEADKPTVIEVVLVCMTGDENKEGKPSNRRWFTLQLWAGDYKLLADNLQLCGDLRFDPHTTHRETVRILGFPAGTVGKARIDTCVNLDWDAKFRIEYKVKRPNGIFQFSTDDYPGGTSYKEFRWNSGPSGDHNTDFDFQFLWRS